MLAYWPSAPMLLAQAVMPPSPALSSRRVLRHLSAEHFGACSVEDCVPDPNELRITGLGGSSAQWTIFVLLTVLTIVPSILICMTPFARLLIVFHFLRQALGLQTTPSNQTLIGCR